MKEEEKSSHCRYVALDIHKYYSLVANEHSCKPPGNGGLQGK